jgi:hypothetical protein
MGDKDQKLNTATSQSGVEGFVMPLTPYKVLCLMEELKAHPWTELIITPDNKIKVTIEFHGCKNKYSYKNIDIAIRCVKESRGPKESEA